MREIDKGYYPHDKGILDDDSRYWPSGGGGRGKFGPRDPLDPLFWPDFP